GLYEEAIALADSANLSDEELQARIGLQGAYVTLKDWKRAYEQSMALQGLNETRQAAKAAEVLDAARTEVERNATSADSLSTELQEVRLISANSIAEAEGRAKLWMFAAAGIALVATFLFVLFIASSRKKHVRFAEELRALKAEVAALKQPRNRLREEPIVPVVPPVVAPAVVAVEEPPAPVAPVVDSEVLAHFRKRAPERLATLRDARARGDMEKVVRVVHTLKPLLAGLDADRFTPLCARLVEPTTIGSPAWNGDVDALETAISSYL
ncbi:MAG TPA: Hpt domain-containing protein, partial [Flavobacteriales bacterium]|nr:Hpt domain-containing protein [Flavobacteriales bacterium]